VNRTVVLLRPFLKRQWPALAISGVGSIAVAAAELARPFPLKLILDHVLRTHPGGRFELTSPDITYVAWVSVLVVGISLVDGVASYLSDVRLQRAGEAIVHDLRVAVYEHLQRLSLRFHQREATGDLVTRVTGDVNAVGDVFAESLGTITASVLLLIGMVIVSLRIDPVLALVAFSVAPPLVQLTRAFRRRIKSTARVQRTNEGRIAGLATESLGAMREVKALGTESYERDRLARRSEKVKQAGIRAATLEGRFTGLIDVMGAIGSALVLGVGVFRVASGALSAGDLVVMNSYARRLYRPLRDIARQANRVSRGMARGDRIAEVLAADVILPDPPHGYRGPQARGEVAFVDVRFGYEPDRLALDGVSLRIAAGERVAVVGRSGAGKSTLAALLARFYDPVEGRVLIDGRDARKCSLEWLRRQVGLVLQDSVLFTGTVAENIAYGCPANTVQILSAAKAADAHAFITELPEGYDTVLGAGGISLSGGQRQRVAMARTLLRDPPILILDEPTAGLDAETEAEVMRGLDVLMRGRTVLTITHSMALARTADRVIVMANGQVVQEGTPGDLGDVEGEFSALAARQGLFGAEAASRSPLPVDPGLPRLPVLCDPGAMAAVLRRSLPPDAPWPDVRVHCLRYKPATNLVVHYDVGLGARWHHAVAMIAAGSSLSRRAGRPANQALAAQVDGRSPAAHPLHHDAGVDALIQWLPLDLSLPGLAVPPSELRNRLRAAGARVVGSDGEPILLSYKPRRRAVLLLGRHIVKLYAQDEDYSRALTGLLVSQGIRDIGGARLSGTLPELRLIVQTRLAGSRPVGPLPAGSVGALLSRLHAADPGGLASRSAGAQLAAAGASARLAAVLVPELAPRLTRLLADLEHRQPSPGLRVAAHGDFHAGQLLVDGNGTAILDFDEMCAAAPALDLATFGAHLARGEADDSREVAQALDSLAEGYGGRPDDLGWYVATAILRRAPFPFRYLEEHWPERIRELVGTAETAVWL